MSSFLASAPEAMHIDHAYGTSTPFSLGVEEEFQLVAPGSWELVSVAQRLLDAAEASGDGDRITAELMQSVIEATTSVCTGTTEAASQLRRLRQRVGELASDAGVAIASAGTHPSSLWEDQKITDRERYRELVEKLRWIAQRELIFGLHVHVGMQSTEQAMYVFNGIRQYLPELLALSANSPFWQGRPTGLRSSRAKVFDSFPRSGIPQGFSGWREFEGLVTRAMQVGAIKDYSYIWWDVRPHPRFGTLEIRACDAQTRLSDTLALTALIQATCAWLSDLFEQRRQLELPPTMLINENKWSAARYGLDGTFIDFDADAIIQTRAAVTRLIERVEPYARALGAADEFAMLDSLLVQNGAERQLETYEQTGSLAAVGQMLARETAVEG